MTQKKIAQMLGLSVATVSLALRDDPKIKPETREKVKRLARLSNYRPNEAARSLASGRTFSIGMILPDFSHPFYADLSTRLHRCLRSKGYVGLFFPITTEEDFNDAFDALLRRNVDGIISGPVAMSLAARGLRDHVPVVYYGVQDEALDIVDTDRYKGAVLAVSHLVSLGHTRIAFLGKNEGSEPRYLGFKHVLEENNIDVIPSLVLGDKEVGYDIGVRYMEELLGSGEELPTAIFFHSDAEAIGGMQVLRRHGIKVPEDISIIGYDDIREAEFAPVPLTTVRTDRTVLAENLVEILLHRIDKKDEEDVVPEKILVEPELVLRDSCSEPKS